MSPMRKIVSCFLPLLMLAAGTTTSSAQQCSSVVHPAGGGTCFVAVSRTRPVSPLTVYGRDTRVVIVVEGVHAADKVLLQEDIVQTAAPDLTFSLLKALLDPLSKLSVSLDDVSKRGNFSEKTSEFSWPTTGTSKKPLEIPSASIVREELIRLQDERQAVAKKINAESGKIETFLKAAAALEGDSELTSFVAVPRIGEEREFV